MAKKTKLYMIRARVSREMKHQIEELAANKGEAEAVLIREMVKEYIAKHRTPNEGASAPAAEPPSEEPEPKQENRRRRVGFHPTNRLAAAAKRMAKALPVIAAATAIQ